MIKFHQCRSTFIISFFFKYCDNNTIYKEIDWIPISKFSSSKNWWGFISRFHLASKNIKEKIFLATGDASTIPSSGFASTITFPRFSLLIGVGDRQADGGGNGTITAKTRSNLERVIHPWKIRSPSSNTALSVSKSRSWCGRSRNGNKGRFC